MKPRILATLGFVATTSVGLIWFARLGAEVLAVPASVASAPMPDADVEGTAALLRAENDALRRRLDEIEARIGASSGSPVSARPASASEGEPAPERGSAEQAERHRVETIAFYEDTLRANPADTAQSLALESSLRDGLAQPSTRAECSAELCRAELAFEDPDARDEAMRRIPDLVPWASDGYASVDPEDPSRVVVYLSAEDRSLPEPGARRG